jgi:hypothetical protein
VAFENKENTGQTQAKVPTFPLLLATHSHKGTEYGLSWQLRKLGLMKRDFHVKEADLNLRIANSLSHSITFLLNFFS